jgi:hypothetical protein
LLLLLLLLLFHLLLLCLLRNVHRRLVSLLLLLLMLLMLLLLLLLLRLALLLILAAYSLHVAASPVCAAADVAVVNGAAADVSSAFAASVFPAFGTIASSSPCGAADGAVVTAGAASTSFSIGCLTGQHVHRMHVAGHLDVLQYAIENGCPWDDRVRVFATESGLL